ncbi:hypothetical protein M9H77_02968 [Catharanthus roseus]|uniref:Uncharacterized protein n=1 Tax=Catharanthus roseus TaxID=4058 RepID=A0ACC0C9X5_CATRO|nr:hypothetical protein M9H77_02968 [Catharanthus roseus]
MPPSTHAGQAWLVNSPIFYSSPSDLAIDPLKESSSSLFFCYCMFSVNSSVTATVFEEESFCRGFVNITGLITSVTLLNSEYGNLYNIIILNSGHDYQGIAYVSKVPFVILDMFNLRSINIDIENETAWVQSGVTLGELYYRIWEKSKIHSFLVGVCPTVGVGGHISGDGYGAMLRKFGLTVDNLLDAQIVDVQVRVLDRLAISEDLFCAISCGGGGASLGIVLAYKIQIVLEPVTIEKFKDQKTVKAKFNALFLGESNRLMDVMNGEFPELGLKKEDCLEVSWVESLLQWLNFKNGANFEVLLNRSLNSVKFLKRKSNYVLKPIPKDGLDPIFKKLVQLEKTGLVLNPYGERMGKIPKTETQFPHHLFIMDNQL